MNKPVVFIDMDGPLADFDPYFWKKCLDIGLVFDCEPSAQVHRFADRHIPDKAQRATARDMVNTTRWFRNLPVVPGAADGINRLAELADVYICTKPLEANLTCRDDKAAWVRNHLGRDWEQRLLLMPDKSLAMGDILLDDAPKEEWLRRAVWTPVIYPTPWNAGVLPDAFRWDWTMDPELLIEQVWWKQTFIARDSEVAA